MTGRTPAGGSGRGVARTYSTWNRIIGICIIAFPIMLFLGFVTHPNILSFAMITNVDEWLHEWRDSDWFHIGHLLVMFAVPFIIGAAIGLMALIRDRGAWYGVFGTLLAVTGAFFLAVDKGALTFVLTAFKDLPDPEFTAIRPALEAIFNREGWLWITWGFILLPLGFIVLMVGLLKDRIIPRWQGVCIILGLLLLLNPDIEIISSTGAALMCVGFLPIGLGFMSGRIAAQVA